MNQERKINDAFSELYVASKGPSIRPPPIWKTMFLTMVALFVSSNTCTSISILHYYLYCIDDNLVHLTKFDASSN